MRTMSNAWRVSSGRASFLILSFSMFALVMLSVLPPAAAAPSYDRRILVLMPGSRGSWDQAGVGQPAIVEHGGLYRMWYSGTDGLTIGIGYVVSRDGRQWTRVIDAPVSITGPGWTGPADSPAVIVRSVGGYEMWFSNGLLGSSIGQASSSDGITWTGATAVLHSGPSGSWDEGGVGQPTVAHDASGYWMWFMGVNSIGGNASIGLATSADGVTWTKSLSNPVLTPRTGEWYQEGVKDPAITIQDSGQFVLFFAGEDDKTSRVGRVTSPDGVSWSAPEMILDLGGFGAADGAYVAGPAPNIVEQDALWYSGSDGLTWRILLAVPSKSLPSAPFVTTTTAAIAFLAGLGTVGTAATVTSDRFRYAFFTIPLAYKVAKKKNLDPFVRGQIYQYIRANPGDYYSSIMNATGATNGNLVYHLHILENEGFIKTVKDGRLVRFYPKDIPVLDGEGIKFSALQTRMLENIARQPGLTQSELAKIMGVRRQTISYNVWFLADAEILEIKKMGREAFIHLAKESDKEGEDE